MRDQVERDEQTLVIVMALGVVLAVFLLALAAIGVAGYLAQDVNRAMVGATAVALAAGGAFLVRRR